MDWDINHPIKEHIAFAGDFVLHIYYYISDDLRDSELKGLGEIVIGENHVHLFLRDGGIYMLRTDGKATSSPTLNEGLAIEFPPDVAEIIGSFINGYKKGGLLPVMSAPLDVQMRWYEYLLDRKDNI